jgi:hypothetical protein
MVKQQARRLSNMEEKDLIQKMEKAGAREISMPKNRAALKAVLLEKAAKKPPLALRLIPVYMIILAAAAVSVYMRVDYNNNEGRVNDLGGVWCTYNDGWQGGNSIVWPPASSKGENSFVKSSPGSEGRGYAIRITGVAGTKLGWGYIGVNTFLSPHATCPECAGIDLAGFTGVKFKIKGKVDTGEVVFIMPYEARAVDKSRGICKSMTSYADYEADITKDITPGWKQVKLVFRRDFKQPTWAKPEEQVNIERVLANENLIKWEYRKGNGHRVDIWIDKLEFY